MRRRHAISPGFFDHYQDIGIGSRKRPNSACKLIVSVVRASTRAPHHSPLAPRSEALRRISHPDPGSGWRRHDVAARPRQRGASGGVHAGDAPQDSRAVAVRMTK